MKPAAEMRLIQEATSFAARAHRHQVRKDGRTPYAAHPFRVAMTVRHLFECEDTTTIVVALLHDTIEDCVVDFDDIESRFGTDVAEIVASLTKNMFLREDAREADYDARLAKADWRARLVKLADVYDNFIDTAGISSAMRKRALARANRAIKLASKDAKKHEESRRAIDAVRELIAKTKKRA
jgi:(p)ppGpp synthase/HD superfamily hydrolase